MHQNVSSLKNTTLPQKYFIVSQTIINYARWGCRPQFDHTKNNLLAELWAMFVLAVVTLTSPK